MLMYFANRILDCNIFYLNRMIECLKFLMYAYLSYNIFHFQIVLMVVIGVSSIMVNDVATKPPLMFSKWPPIYQNTKSPSLRHQIFSNLRTSGRIPQNVMVKRYPSNVGYAMMRPMKYAQLKKTPIASAPSYYRPTISTPPRYRIQKFQASPQASNAGDYIFENPFTNFVFPPVRTIVSLFLHTLLLYKLKCISFNSFIFRIRKKSASPMKPNTIQFKQYQHQI